MSVSWKWNGDKTYKTMAEVFFVCVTVCDGIAFWLWQGFIQFSRLGFHFLGTHFKFKTCVLNSIPQCLAQASSCARSSFMIAWLDIHNSVKQEIKHNASTGITQLLGHHRHRKTAVTNVL